MEYAALFSAIRQLIFKLILVVYFLCQLLPDDVIRSTAEAFASKESNELMDGQVLRILVLHVKVVQIIMKNKHKYKSLFVRLQLAKIIFSKYE